jgi:hypothetical protein
MRSQTLLEVHSLDGSERMACGGDREHVVLQNPWEYSAFYDYN